MRLERIMLSWFRGAAREAKLELGARSLVLFGPNGAGKSSFVDGLEICLRGGRVEHLSHEYSGRYQEKGLINTHAPAGTPAAVEVALVGGDTVAFELRRAGGPLFRGREGSQLAEWEYRRTVLRQDELAEFIKSKKSEKYSALLPLLGLDGLELAAENLRQLARQTEELSRVEEKRRQVAAAAARRKELFGAATDEDLARHLSALRERYASDSPPADDETPARTATLVTASIDERISTLTAQQREAVALQTIGESSIPARVSSVRARAADVAGRVEPLIKEKLDALRATSEYVARSPLAAETLNCPACGREIPTTQINAHLSSEMERLAELSRLLDAWKGAVGELCDDINSLRTEWAKADLAGWKASLEGSGLEAHAAYLNGLDVGSLRSTCEDVELGDVEAHLLPLIATARAAAEKSAPDVQELIRDRARAETIRSIEEARPASNEVTRVDALVAFLRRVESEVRSEIKSQAREVFDTISGDIQALWEALNPKAPITDVKLYTPRDADKAIDIALRFHGVDQDSPRLTLSEGYRNALGLAIFLAMAKREAGRDQPIFLDDVVVSLDRAHRGMLARLLEEQFADRQIVLFTHDRGWFAELRRLLDKKRWAFRSLMPYASPDIGIQFMERDSDLAAARAHLANRPEDAGHDARRIMDMELAFAAEKLELRLPYLRGEANDHRTWNDFLGRLIADARRSFKKLEGERYEENTAALATFDTANRLLGAWANRDSHTFDSIDVEAEALINACEAALAELTCSKCRKPVWYMEAGNGEMLKCDCGYLRWKR